MRNLFLNNPTHTLISNYPLVNVKQIKLFTETNTALVRENFGSVEVADVFKTRLHIPFGRKQAYAKEVMKANLERLARLIKVCGFLMQTKVYLFWSCCVHADLFGRFSLL